MMTLMCDIGDMRASACICACASVPIINEEPPSFKREVFFGEHAHSNLGGVLFLSLSRGEVELKL